MKHVNLLVLALAVLLFSGSAVAQHGHGVGGGMGAAKHGGMNGEASNTPQHKTVSDRLAQNSKLSGKLQTLTGMPAQQACSGFKNLGQCVAAAHVSKNLGINFACLKADMTGQAPAQGSSCPTGTGTKSMSLGKAIQTLSPDVNSKTEAKRGTHQANQDLKGSSNS